MPVRIILRAAHDLLFIYVYILYAVPVSIILRAARDLLYIYVYILYAVPVSIILRAARDLPVGLLQAEMGRVLHRRFLKVCV